MSVVTRSQSKMNKMDNSPSFVDKNGNKYWQNNSNLLAIEYDDGSKKWFENGKLHRDNDLPAIEFANGEKRWYQHGELHRDNDLPAVESANGDKRWFKNGEIYKCKLNGNITEFLDRYTS
jgi:hypothetical protein